MGLIVGEGLLGGGEGGGGGLQQGVERRNPAGRFCDGFAGHRRPAFDVLQLDQSFKVGKHLLLSKLATVNSQQSTQKWAHLDSNQGPTSYEPAALTN